MFSIGCPGLQGDKVRNEKDDEDHLAHRTTRDIVQILPATQSDINGRNGFHPAHLNNNNISIFREMCQVHVIGPTPMPVK